MVYFQKETSMKATAIYICIYTWQRTDGGQVDTSNPDTWPPKEAAMGRSLANALAQMEFEGKTPPLRWDLCSLSDGNVGVQNQNAVTANGINPQRLPAMQIWGEYPDGHTAQYILGANIVDDIAQVVTPEAIRDRINRIWDGRVSTKKGIICTIVPQLCDLPGWLWLIAAGYTTFESVTSKDTRRTVYGGAAAVLWYDFFQRGGFDWIKNK
jgi:hypothetical protein